MEGELETGEVQKHLQSTVGVPLSQERNLQLLRYGLVMSWWLGQGCNLPGARTLWLRRGKRSQEKNDYFIFPIYIEYLKPEKSTTALRL